MVLFPTQDNVVNLVSDNRAELQTYFDFVLPEETTIRLLTDKTAFHQWASTYGFPVPESYVVESQSQLNYVLNKIEYPIVIKPVFHTEEWEKKSPKNKILKLHYQAEIKNIGFQLFEAGGKFLIQKWIPSGDANVHFCLMYIDKDGREVAHYTGRKLIQWPRLTGSTCIAVGTSNDEIYKITKAVLQMLIFQS